MKKIHVMIAAVLAAALVLVCCVRAELKGERDLEIPDFATSTITCTNKAYEPPEEPAEPEEEPAEPEDDPPYPPIDVSLGFVFGGEYTFYYTAMVPVAYRDFNRRLVRNVTAGGMLLYLETVGLEDYEVDLRISAEGLTPYSYTGPFSGLSLPEEQAKMIPFASELCLAVIRGSGNMGVVVNIDGATDYGEAQIRFRIAISDILVMAGPDL